MDTLLLFCWSIIYLNIPGFVVRLKERRKKLRGGSAQQLYFSGNVSIPISFFEIEYLVAFSKGTI